MLLSAMFSGCVGQQAEEAKVGVPQEIVAGLGRDAGTGRLKAHSLLTGIYEQLVRVDPEMRPLPHLAESWEVCPEGKIWTFYLREGVKFHDGTPMDASAVKQSIEMFDATRPGFLAGLISIVVVDDHTIELHFNDTFALLHNIALMPIVSPAVIEVVDDEYSVSSPVGTGPLVFLEHHPGEKMILIRNDNYWGGIPTLERVTLMYIPDAATRAMALEAGEIDMIIDTGGILPEQAPLLDAHPEIEILTGPDIITHYLTFNNAIPPFDDRRVRKAVQYAIDQESIVRYAVGLDFGHPSTSVVYHGLAGWIHPDDLHQFNNPAKAQELLQEAGWIDTDGDGVLDRDGENFKVTLILNQGFIGRWPYMAIAEIVQAQLREVGIVVEIMVVERGVWRDTLERGEAEMSIWCPWFFSPRLVMHSWFHSEGRENLATGVFFNNARADELIELAKRSVSDKEAQVYILELQELIAEELPVIPIYDGVMINAVRYNIKGYELHPWFIIN
ncbi:ABC transporter substrate-binding protein, partial [Dehalococcoidia bacterium]|nr:ABC transporter substrate-binding protein [Dehalococcoidia bacterium]